MDHTVGTEAEMTVCFTNVLSLLALVTSVREDNFERHLQEERKMFKYCFAFGHLNCTRLCLNSKFIWENYKIPILMLQWILRNVLWMAHF